MDRVEQYLTYLRDVRRYSPRTLDIYGKALVRFFNLPAWCDAPADGAEEDPSLVLTVPMLRRYESFLMEEGLSARTVHQQMSALSGFAAFLVREGAMTSNPVRSVRRPKMKKRLPEFYRLSSMDAYLEATAHAAGEDELELLLGFGPGSRAGTARTLYERRLHRLTVSLLYGTGIRRAELINLNINSFDTARGVLRVRGKGDKMREIPLIPSLCQEICLYLKAAESIAGEPRGADAPLLVTFQGGRLYPQLVDRIIKAELDGYGITGRKSPHLLRHTLATELLDGGTDLNSIKEMLGHSSLAATQVYTHGSVEKLKKVYNNAHPRAKKGGNDD